MVVAPIRSAAGIAVLSTFALLLSTLAVAEEPTPQAVETSMHGFMEYVYQPAYKRLQPAMAAAPTDNAGWKVLKGESLVMAEAANLLLARPPKTDAADWQKLSVEVRTHGGELYRAAKAKDFPAARTAYETMLKSCNACHDQFHKGKPQLTP